MAEEVGVVEGAAGIVEIGITAALAEAVTKTMVSPMEEVASKGTKAPNTLICHLVNGRGVACIINGGGGLIFVANPPPAPGRTSTRPNLLNNERLTSSPKVMI